MGAFRSLAAVAVLLTLATGASAEAQIKKPGHPPGLKSGIQYFGGATVTLPCAVTNNGVAPSVCLDWVNSQFIVNGTSYASMGAAVAALGGQDNCATTIGTGVTCTGTQAEKLTYATPSGGYMIVVNVSKYPTPGSGVTVAGGLVDGSNNRVYAESNSGGAYFQQTASTGGPMTGYGAAPSGAAFYLNGSALQGSINGSSIQSVTGTALSGAATVYVGNASSGSAPFGVPVTAYRLYVGNFTNAQVQAASLQ